MFLSFRIQHHYFLKVRANKTGHNKYSLSWCYKRFVKFLCFHVLISHYSHSSNILHPNSLICSLENFLIWKRYYFEGHPHTEQDKLLSSKIFHYIVFNERCVMRIFYPLLIISINTRIHSKKEKYLNRSTCIKKIWLTSYTRVNIKRRRCGLLLITTDLDWSWLNWVRKQFHSQKHEFDMSLSDGKYNSLYLKCLKFFDRNGSTLF